MYVATFSIESKCHDTNVISVIIHKNHTAAIAIAVLHVKLCTILFGVYAASPSAFPLSSCSLCLRLSSSCKHSSITERDAVLFNAGENMMRVCLGSKVRHLVYKCEDKMLQTKYNVLILTSRIIRST